MVTFLWTIQHYSQATLLAKLCGRICTEEIVRQLQVDCKNKADTLFYGSGKDFFYFLTETHVLQLPQAISYKILSWEYWNQSVHTIINWFQVFILLFAKVSYRCLCVLVYDGSDKSSQTGTLLCAKNSTHHHLQVLRPYPVVEIVVRW